MPTGHDIAMSIRAAYLAMHRQTNACLLKLGVTADQFVILAVLAKRDGITQQDLVRHTSSDPNTVRAMLVLLERRGLVVRERHPTDGRARSVVLTSKGRKTYEKLWAVSDPLRMGLLALFQPEEAKTLVEYLARIPGTLAQPEDSRRKPRIKMSSANYL